MRIDTGFVVLGVYAFVAALIALIEGYRGKKGGETAFVSVFWPLYLIVVAVYYPFEQLYLFGIWLRKLKNCVKEGDSHE